jgi:hypothetical protein
VVDFTYVLTWSGMEFTAFVSDVFNCRFVAWRTASNMPTVLLWSQGIIHVSSVTCEIAPSLPMDSEITSPPGDGTAGSAALHFGGKVERAVP